MRKACTTQSLCYCLKDGQNRENYDSQSYKNEEVLKILLKEGTRQMLGSWEKN